ncbi:glucose-methanol-choline oxidoreductase [Xylariaceae sp. FL0804]|nr:glucose-methanol-choline oxidoreductase [Xylariaceae sp. FL0804]
MISRYLLALCSVGASWAAPKSPRSAQSFDYVIVGGGNAGLTVANRLSEDPSVSVAVIEAGTHIENVVGNLSAVPGYVSTLQGVVAASSEAGWGFQTEPQTLGGSTSINNMAYARSAKGAYQVWADTVSDQSYTWEQVLPYYLKSMDFTPPDDETRRANATPSYDDAMTNEGGPLDATYPAYAESWSTWVAEGLEDIGVNRTDALIDGSVMGGTWQLLTVDHATGHRASSDTNFLRPVLGRSNLKVFTETMAERIIFDDSKTATGVEVTRNNKTSVIRAKKEVIVSAGVFQSPQLLMVSGVGPRAVLEQYGIDVVADRPGVGQGMKDHIFLVITFEIALPSFVNTATGPLTNPGGDYVGLEKLPASLRSNWSSETKSVLNALPSDWPEIQYLMLPAALTGGTTAGASYGTIFTALQAPQSTGNVTISSALMSDKPLINPNYMSAQADVDVMVAAFRRVREMVTSTSLADIIISEFLPGPSVQTDDEIFAYMELALSPMSHAHATNAMGKYSDPNAVVGTTGKVYGVNGLRVIDASAFPFLLPGPAPQTHVYMLAEKLSDAIKKGE